MTIRKGHNIKFKSKKMANKNIVVKFTTHETWMYAPKKDKKYERMTQTNGQLKATVFELIPHKDDPNAFYLLVEGGTLYLDKQNSNGHLFLNSPIGNVHDSLIYAWKVNKETGLMDAVRNPDPKTSFAVVRAKRLPPKFDGTPEENDRYNKLRCEAINKEYALKTEWEWMPDIL